MRRPLRLLPLFLLLACEETELPPGELIGTFSFVATLDASGGEGRCRFDGAPERITFEGVLSRDPEGEGAWLQIGSTLREGWLRSARFELGLPKEPDGTVRMIPRQLRACGCNLGMAETIRGRLLARAAESCDDDLPDESVLGEYTCPRVDESGNLSWDTCAAACGELEERVRLETPCTCEIDGVPATAPEECSFVYRMEAKRIGG